MLESIVSRTCSEKAEAKRYSKIIADQKPWLNSHTLNYLATKELARTGRISCYYEEFDYNESTLDGIWRHVLALNHRYYITSDPEIYPISADKVDQALNQFNGPVLKRVQTSGLFEREPPIPHNPAILIFRRHEGESRLR